jgi:hypothetical protein
MPDGKMLPLIVCGWNPCNTQQIGISRSIPLLVLHSAVGVHPFNLDFADMIVPVQLRDRGVWQFP